MKTVIICQFYKRFHTLVSSPYLVSFCGEILVTTTIKFSSTPFHLFPLLNDKYHSFLWTFIPSHSFPLLLIRSYSFPHLDILIILSFSHFIPSHWNSIPSHFIIFLSIPYRQFTYEKSMPDIDDDCPLRPRATLEARARIQWGYWLYVLGLQLYFYYP